MVVGFNSNTEHTESAATRRQKTHKKMLLEIATRRRGDVRRTGRIEFEGRETKGREGKKRHFAERRGWLKRRALVELSKLEEGGNVQTISTLSAGLPGIRCSVELSSRSFVLAFSVNCTFLAANMDTCSPEQQRCRTTSPAQSTPLWGMNITCRRVASCPEALRALLRSMRELITSVIRSQWRQS